MTRRMKTIIRKSLRTNPDIRVKIFTVHRGHTGRAYCLHGSLKRGALPRWDHYPIWSYYQIDNRAKMFKRNAALNAASVNPLVVANRPELLFGLG